MASILYIMQGAPGSGKSTFIVDNDLERYTVRMDDLRRAINSDTVLTDMKTGVTEDAMDWSGRNSALAFSMAEEIVSYRMRLGETIILDGINCNRKTIGRILHTAVENRYQVRFVDMQKHTTLEEALKRNAKRPSNRKVPDNVVRSAWDSCNGFKVQSGNGEARIDSEEMLSDRIIPIADADGWSSVNVIGDVQGCWNALRKAFVASGSDNPEYGLDSSQLYVFTGDLLDRGPANDKVYEWLTRHCHDHNVVLVMGNHDSYFRYYASEQYEDSLPYKTKISIRQIRDSMSGSARDKLLRKSSRRVYNSFRKCFIFRRNGRLFLATHGGIDSDVVNANLQDDGLGMGYWSQSYFYYGSGSVSSGGDYAIDIDAMIHRKNQANPDNRIFQIHGHRNEHHVGKYDYDDVWNLENAVEAGGALRMATIDKLGNVSVSEYED